MVKGLPACSLQSQHVDTHWGTGNNIFRVSWEAWGTDSNGPTQVHFKSLSPVYLSLDRLGCQDVNLVQAECARLSPLGTEWIRSVSQSPFLQTLCTGTPGHSTRPPSPGEHCVALESLCCDSPRLPRLLALSSWAGFYIHPTFWGTAGFSVPFTANSLLALRAYKTHLFYVSWRFPLLKQEMRVTNFLEAVNKLLLENSCFSQVGSIMATTPGTGNQR